MTAFDWGALDAALAHAAAAWKENAALPPAAAIDMTELAGKLQAAQPEIDRIAALIAAHPGAITAADIMLTYLASLDAAWAAPLKSIVDALPGGLAAAQDKLPTIIWLLTTFAPAPGWGDGGTGALPGPQWQRGGIPPGAG